MDNLAKDLPLSQKEIEETLDYLDKTLTVSDPDKGKPCEEVFAEVRAKYAKF